MLLSSDPDPTLGLLKTKIKSYVHGELPHAEDTLPALYELMENDESIKEMPFPTPAPPDQQATGGDWEGLKKAELPDQWDVPRLPVLCHQVAVINRFVGGSTRIFL